MHETKSENLFSSPSPLAYTHISVHFCFIFDKCQVIGDVFDVDDRDMESAQSAHCTHTHTPIYFCIDLPLSTGLKDLTIIFNINERLYIENCTFVVCKCAHAIVRACALCTFYSTSTGARALRVCVFIVLSSVQPSACLPTIHNE